MKCEEHLYPDEYFEQEQENIQDFVSKRQFLLSCRVIAARNLHYTLRNCCTTNSYTPETAMQLEQSCHGPQAAAATAVTCLKYTISGHFLVPTSREWSTVLLRYVLRNKLKPKQQCALKRSSFFRRCRSLFSAVTFGNLFFRFFIL